MTWLNIGCGNFAADPPWVNTDVVRTELCHPDVLTDALRLPIADASVERAYLGHVLEHVPWDDVPLLLIEVRRVLVPNGHLAIVGPDLMRCMRQAHATNDWQVVVEAMEDDHDYQAWARGETPWKGLRHCWNCYEERLVRVLVAMGFANVEPLPITDPLLDAWPVVSRAAWQCAVIASR